MNKSSRLAAVLWPADRADEEISVDVRILPERAFSVRADEERAITRHKDLRLVLTCLLIADDPHSATRLLINCLDRRLLARERRSYVPPFGRVAHDFEAQRFHLGKPREARQLTRRCL